MPTPPRVSWQDDEDAPRVPLPPAIARLPDPKPPPPPRDVELGAAIQQEADDHRWRGLGQVAADLTHNLTGVGYRPESYAPTDSPVKRLLMQREDARVARRRDPTSPESQRFQQAVLRAMPGLYTPEEAQHIALDDEKYITDFGKMREVTQARRDALVEARDRFNQGMANTNEQNGLRNAAAIRAAGVAAAGHHDEAEAGRSLQRELAAQSTAEHRLDRESRERLASEAADLKAENSAQTKEANLRKELQGSKVFKDYQDAQIAYDKVAGAFKDASAAGDLAGIFAFMKTLDPGSSVREGEFANAQNASGVPGRFTAAYNKLLTGQRLTPEQRADFLTTAQRQLGAQKDAYERLAEQYRGLATGAGADPGRVALPIVPGVAAPQIRRVGGVDYQRHGDGKWYPKE